MGIKDRINETVKAIKRNISAIIIAMKHPDTPWFAKALGVITIAYALSPIDLIPDFIPILGYLDDLIILPILAGLTIKLIPKDVWEEALKISQEQSNAKESMWYYSIPIILIWVLLLFIILVKFGVVRI